MLQPVLWKALACRSANSHAGREGAQSRVLAESVNRTKLVWSLGRSNRTRNVCALFPPTPPPLTFSQEICIHRGMAMCKYLHSYSHVHITYKYCTWWAKRGECAVGGVGGVCAGVVGVGSGVGGVDDLLMDPSFLPCEVSATRTPSHTSARIVRMVLLCVQNSEILNDSISHFFPAFLSSSCEFCSISLFFFLPLPFHFLFPL